eukprot:GHVU01002395.1.p1 GENE.GHVU01002395.1~~GHVU01002395.1.p1  ORF type:complete len:105 (+),score=16.74 GHVU01002395.1:1-315(+)
MHTHTHTHAHTHTHTRAHTPRVTTRRQSRRQPTAMHKIGQKRRGRRGAPPNLLSHNEQRKQQRLQEEEKIQQIRDAPENHDGVDVQGKIGVRVAGHPEKRSTNR